MCGLFSLRLLGFGAVHCDTLATRLWQLARRQVCFCHFLVCVSVIFDCQSCGLFLSGNDKCSDGGHYLQWHHEGNQYVSGVCVVTCGGQLQVVLW